MRGQTVLVSVLLVVVALWFGTSIGALLTGAEQAQAMGPAIVIAGGALVGAAWLGIRAAQRGDTTYW